MELVFRPVLSVLIKMKLPLVAVLAYQVVTLVLLEPHVVHVALVVFFLEIVFQVVQALNISSKLQTLTFVAVSNVYIRAILAPISLFVLLVFRDTFLMVTVWFSVQIHIMLII